MRIQEILEWLDESGCEYCFKGDREQVIEGFSSLGNYKDRTITWIKNVDSYNKFKDNSHILKELSCAVLQNGLDLNVNNAIITPKSKEVFFAILRHFWGHENKKGSVGDGTVISGNTMIDSTVIIGCNCSVVGDVSIGPHTVIEHNVIIQGRVKIGEGCYIQSGAVIGIDGYGYSQDIETKRKKMIEHFGGVIIGNDVFIGSHVNIARGTIDDTVIGDGVKIAPSTHIGHNNVIGDDTAIICSVLYGSIKTGNRSYITASTIANQMVIGSDTVIGMGSVVTKPIGDHVVAYGIPAKEIKENNSGL